MKSKEVSVTSEYDEVPLYGTYYQSKHKKGLVVVFHGMAEHRGRYEEFVKHLSNQGYDVLTVDHRGHGQTALIQGYFADENGWKQNLQDLHQLVQEVNKDDNLPLYIFGHSMGSLVARSYLKSYHDEINGVILSGIPADNSLTKAGRMLANTIAKTGGQRRKSKLLDNMIVNSFNKTISNPETDFDWLSYNKDNVRNYLNDNQCGFSFTASGYADLLTGMIDVYKDKQWQVTSGMPILFVSGEDDPCSYPKDGFNKSVSNLRERGFSNITTKLYPNMRHEILQEDNKLEVMEDIVIFLDSLYA